MKPDERMTLKTDWVVAGFAKCGTTALVRYLSAMPKINVATTNSDGTGIDLHYFDNPKRGSNYLQARYKSGFYNGHKNPTYLQHTQADQVLERMIADNPNMKIIVCTRPLKSVLASWYSMHKRIARTGKIGSHFVCKDNKSRSYYSTITLDDYFEIFYDKLDHGACLNKLFGVFSASQIYVMSMKSLALNPYDTLSEIYKFISGLSLNHDPENYCTVPVKDYDNFIKENLCSNNIIRIELLQQKLDLAKLKWRL